LEFEMTTFVDTDLHNDFTEAAVKMLQIVDPTDLARMFARLEPCAWTGKIGSDEIVLGLCEHCDVVPEILREHAVSADVFRLSRGR
jgi:hypothetical protein